MHYVPANEVLVRIESLAEALTLAHRTTGRGAESAVVDCGLERRPVERSHALAVWRIGVATYGRKHVCENDQQKGHM